MSQVRKEADGEPNARACQTVRRRRSAGGSDGRGLRVADSTQSLSSVHGTPARCHRSTRTFADAGGRTFPRCNGVDVAAPDRRFDHRRDHVGGTDSSGEVRHADFVALHESLARRVGRDRRVLCVVDDPSTRAVRPAVAVPRGHGVGGLGDADGVSPQRPPVLFDARHPPDDHGVGRRDPGVVAQTATPPAGAVDPRRRHRGLPGGGVQRPHRPGRGIQCEGVRAAMEPVRRTTPGRLTPFVRRARRRTGGRTGV